MSDESDFIDILIALACLFVVFLLGIWIGNESVVREVGSGSHIVVPQTLSPDGEVKRWQLKPVDKTD